MALYYRGRHSMQLVGQRQELRARQELWPRWLMLRCQVRDSEYGSVTEGATGLLGTEDVKARVTIWYWATVGLTVSGLLKVRASTYGSTYWWAAWI